MSTRVATVHFTDKNFAGVPQLLEDLRLLAEDTESADILFFVGKEELPVYAHKVILKARCQSFKVKRGEICRIPGCSVSPSVPPGSPTPVRLPHFQGETFRQFIAYVYTGKVQHNFFEKSKKLPFLVVTRFLEHLRLTDFIARQRCIRNAHDCSRSRGRGVTKNLRRACNIDLVHPQCVYIFSRWYGNTRQVIRYSVKYLRQHGSYKKLWADPTIPHYFLHLAIS